MNNLRLVKMFLLFSLFNLIMGQEFHKNGDLIYGFKRVLNDSGVQETFYLGTVSCCFKLCLLKPSCATASAQIKIEGQQIECKFSSTPVHDANFEDNPNGFLFAKESSFNLCFGDDGKFYYVETTSESRNKGREYCQETYSHGNLFMPKYLINLQSFTKCMEKQLGPGNPEVGAKFLIDLNRESGTDVLTWNDGTPFLETEVSKTLEQHSMTSWYANAYELRYKENGASKFWEIYGVSSIMTSTRAVCQIDPFSVK